MITPIKKYIPNNTLRRSGQPILGVKFIVAHDTANPDSTADGNVDYFIKSANEIQASAHTFIDDVKIIECIPATERALHVRGVTPTDNLMFGVDSNDYGLGIELCYFPKNKDRTQKAYNSYVEYISFLCTTYKLDPRMYVVSHFMLDPGNKIDPMNAFKIIGKTWEQFIKDLNSNIIVPTPPNPYKDKIKTVISILQEFI